MRKRIKLVEFSSREIFKFDLKIIESSLSSNYSNTLLSRVGTSYHSVRKTYIFLLYITVYKYLHIFTYLIESSSN